MRIVIALLLLAAFAVAPLPAEAKQKKITNGCTEAQVLKYAKCVDKPPHPKGLYLLHCAISGIYCCANGDNGIVPGTCEKVGRMTTVQDTTGPVTGDKAPGMDAGSSTAPFVFQPKVFDSQVLQ